MRPAVRPAFVAFDPPPAAGELPSVMPSPFDPAPPHPLARRAAEALLAELASGRVPGAAAEGKMYGVVVARDAGGRVGWLRGFSGMQGGRWEVDGFVPPLFDAAARDAVWPAGEAELAALAASIDELTWGPAARALDAEQARLAARHRAAAVALAARHREQRARRAHARSLLHGGVSAGAALDAALRALAQQSRGDTAERRRQRTSQAAERADLDARRAVLAGERDALVARRAARSRELYAAIHAAYVAANARGERRPLRALWPTDAVPPGGAGDCAAPKLLAHAFATGLRPLALAEVWWGPPPVGGGRTSGAFYPACRGKCGPLLAFMLEGLAVAPAPLFGADAVAADEPRAVYEDRWLVVVDKPCGLLSVPGRSGRLRDSVETRLRARLPDARGPLIVHRLDLDTSGLMIVARDEATHAALQRAFARRQVDKRYVAWLDGVVAGERGAIDLALRVDLDDRPRQLHDPIHGRAALTQWRVLERRGGRTRVELIPRTGRTHQLRVHAAHPRGLGVPIVGDRLYGTAGDRLMLHAAALGFAHPHTGAPIAIERPAPF